MKAKTPLSLRETWLLAMVACLLMPILLAAPLVVSRAMGFPLANAIGLNGGNFFFFALVSQTASLLLVFTYVAKRLADRRLPWSTVGFRKVPIRRSIKYILGYYPLVVACLVTIAVIAAGMGAAPPSSEHHSQAALYGPFWARILMIVFIAPVIEELLFRGMLLENLLHRMRPLHASWSLIVVLITR